MDRPSDPSSSAASSATATPQAGATVSPLRLPVGPLGGAGSTGSFPGATQSMLPTVVHLPPRRTLTPWLVTLGIAAIAYLFRHTLTLAFVAFGLAYVLTPAVRRVQRWGLPRPLAIFVILVGVLASVALVVSMLLPEFLRQIEALVKSVPKWSAEIQQHWLPVLRNRWHLRVPARTDELFSQLGLKANAIAPRLASLLNDSLIYARILVESVFLLLIVLALSYYLLMDYERILDRSFELVPHRARQRVRAIAREIDETLRHFVQGQLLVMGILGVLFAIGLSALGVPAGWAIGLFAGMISFVPYLGFFVALGMALFMTALQARGIYPLVAVTGVMTAVHLLDLTLITPRIVGGQAKVSPIVVILSLIAGGSVFGFVGILVAIPVASVLRILLRELIYSYKNSTFFLAGSQSSLQSVPITPATQSLQAELTASLLAPMGPPLPPITNAPVRSGAPEETEGTSTQE